MHRKLSPEEMHRRNSDDVKESIDRMKAMWLKDHPPGTFMVRCASNWSAKDGGLVMIVGYGPGDSDDVYDMNVTVIACARSVKGPIETLSVGDAKRHFLLDLDRLSKARK